jgi:hypothetical protein
LGEVGGQECVAWRGLDLSFGIPMRRKARDCLGERSLILGQYCSEQVLDVDGTSTALPSLEARQEYHLLGLK